MKIAKFSAVVMFVLAFSSVAFAGTTPELDPSIAGSALMLIGGAVLIVRNHAQKKK
jgi:hypothetical protein